MGYDRWKPDIQFKIEMLMSIIDYPDRTQDSVRYDATKREVDALKMGGETPNPHRIRSSSVQLGIFSPGS